MAREEAPPQLEHLIDTRVLLSTERALSTMIYYSPLVLLRARNADSLCVEKNQVSTSEERVEYRDLHHM